MATVPWPVERDCGNPHLLILSPGAQSLGVMSGTPNTAGILFSLAFPTALPTLLHFNLVHIYLVSSM